MNPRHLHWCAGLSFGEGLHPTVPAHIAAGCSEDRDRHGNIRIYYRAKGHHKVRLRAMPWTAEFMAEYEAAKVDVATVKWQTITAGTWRSLCARYFSECADYLQLDDRTRRVRRGIIEATFDEPIAPESPRLFRDIPISRITTNEVEVLRDRKLAFPEAAAAV